MSDLPARGIEAALDRVLTDLLRRAPQLEAAAVVSFDGLPMASALPEGMDEDRVAAMSAALLSLGERAADGLGRGGLQQVYVEGDDGTVFLVSADDEAVLVAVAARAAKAGLMLFEVKRAARDVAAALGGPAVPEVPAARVSAVAPAEPTPDVTVPDVTVPEPEESLSASTQTESTLPAEAPATTEAEETEAEESAADEPETPMISAPPLVVSQRNPSDLVPPAAPPTVLAASADEDVSTPNVVWAPSSARSSNGWQ
jgi:predicted regulator of Ras-like GTPase activity (Roadblock/LC7/MglB family)